MECAFAESTVIKATEDVIGTLVDSDSEGSENKRKKSARS